MYNGPLLHYDCCPYRVEKLGETCTGRTPYSHSGRYLRDMSVSQGTPDTANKPLEARREAGNRFTHTTLVMPGLKTSSLRKASGYISVV